MTFHASVDVVRKPDWSHRPDIEDLIVSLPRGTQLVRIFDADKAAGRYEPFDYNPVLIEHDLPTTRGRYSARQPKRKKEQTYSYLYVAEHKKDELSALMECIFLLGYGRIAGSSRRMVSLTSISQFAFAYATSSVPLTLIDVSSAIAADRLKADFSVLQGFDYRETRAWGRYIRSLSPDVDGIYYQPVQYGSMDRGANILLFGPPGGNGGHISPYQEISRFRERGRARLKALQRDANVFFSDMIA